MDWRIIHYQTCRSHRVQGTVSSGGSQAQRTVGVASFLHPEEILRNKNEDKTVGKIPTF
jgi:hypothetical protein